MKFWISNLVKTENIDGKLILTGKRSKVNKVDKTTTMSLKTMPYVLVCKEVFKNYALCFWFEAVFTVK